MKNKHIGSSLSVAIKEQVKNKDFRVEFEHERAISDIAQVAYNLRINAGLTQKALAEKSHTTQQVIARLESGKDHRLPSFDLLARVASAVGKRLAIQFV